MPTGEAVDANRRAPRPVGDVDPAVERRGACRVRQAGEASWTRYPAGTEFVVPGKSYFEIAVDEGIPGWYGPL